MTNAILAYASYLPSWRVDPAGRGTARRIVASFDEDAITMSVAAARSLRAAESARSLVLATSSPAYLDKTNATTVHAALGLDRRIPASDAIGTARSTLAAVRAAVAGQGALIVAADVRTGRPGSADERTGTDAAAAVLYASEQAMVQAHQAVQALGGAGFLADSVVSRLFRDAKLMEIGAGTSEIRRMLIGRELVGAVG